MPDPQIEAILNEVRSRGGQSIYDSALPEITPIPTKIETGKVKDVEYNVHTDAIYDRLNDGTYVPRFENYAGGIGNEDRLAKQQSGWEQAWHGVDKMVAKIGTYALDATVGTVYGIFNAIGEGSIEGLYDNDFSNKMDDWNKRLDYALPNYYTNEQKSMGLLRSMGTVNFWANDVGGGLAFVGGAILPELAIGAVTGGSSLPVSFAKIGLRAGTKYFLRAGTKKVIKEGLEVGAKTAFNQGIDNVGLNLLRGQRFAKIGEYTGEAIKTAGFLVRTSNFEAGMEARHNLHQVTSEFLDNFEQSNGRMPTFEEYSSFMDDAVNASNWVYGANMAILSVSNMAMFGAKFGVGVNLGKKFNNFGNRIIGLGVKKKARGGIVATGSNKFQKFLGNSYLILGKAATEGLYEEGLQGVAGKTMQNYLKAKYDPEYEQTYSLWSSMTDAFAEQYGTKDGWKEMAIGMIIGMGAPSIQGQMPNGFGKNSRRNREKRLRTDIDATNEQFLSKRQEILKNIERSNAMFNFRNRLETQEEFDEDTDISNTIINTEFIKTQEHLKTPGEIVEEFNAIIDNHKFSNEQIEDLGGEESAAAYKTLLKNNFERDAKNYRDAKSLVSSLGLGGKLKDSVGNIQEIGEALTMNFMMGKTSLSKAQAVASQIDALVGTEGVFNAMEHYNNLSQEKKSKIDQLKKKKRRLRDLRKLATKYGQQVEGVGATAGRKLKPETIQRNYLKATEKLVLTNTKITELESEIANISEAIDLDFRADNLSLNATLPFDPTFQRITNTVADTVEELDKLNTYIESLKRAGKAEDAAALTYLMEQFKQYSDAHRQMNSDFRRMFDTNFFQKTKEGQALRNTIVGRKYVMSDEFRKLLRENDELIDQSLRKSGIKNFTNVEAYIEKTLEKNEELSEREKYRRESVIRTILGAERLRTRMFEVQTEYQEITESAQEITSTNPLEGDTIRLKKRISPEGKDLSNLDIINQMIDDIVEEIDAIRNVKGSEKEIEDLENRIEELKAIEVGPELEDGDYEKALSASEITEEELTDEQKELLTTYEKFIKREEELRNAEQQLKDLKANRKFKIASTEEYQKLKNLTQKKQEGTLTPDERIELDEVIEDIDQWLLITGTVVEGIRLSDLIQQKIVLESTPIIDIENVGETTIQEVMDQVDFSEKSSRVDYSLGQTYEGVTAIGTKDGIEISGLTRDKFEELTGVIDYKTNEQGNILITPEVQQSINELGNIAILPTDKDLNTNYSIVLRTQPDIDGNPQTNPLKSNFNEADYNGEMNPDAIYDNEIGDVLTLQVNATDPWNQRLLKKYKSLMGSAKSTVVTEEDIEEALSEDTKYQDLTLDLEVLEEEEKKATTLKKPAITKKRIRKQKAVEKRRRQVEDNLIKQANKSGKKSTKKSLEDVLKELRRALVIRVKDQDGNFVAVLKAKRQGVKSAESLMFEDLRDQIVADTDFILRLTNTDAIEDIPVSGRATVKKILIGHPNFNYIRNEDGSYSRESRPITQEQLQHISDIGYVQNGEIFTKSKEKGINTTFLSKSIKQASNTKIPFIVLTKGKTKFAYPIKISPQEKRDLQEFRDIYESDMRPVDKINALHTYMAERGIDIKQPGNSFSMWNLTNDDKFFNEKMSQMEAMDYFREMDSWLDPKTPIAEDILGQASINIDMTNSLHSPKLQIDFSGLDIKPSPIRETKELEDKTNKETMQSGSGVANFLHKCR